MDVVSTDSHQRGFGEAAARGAKCTSTSTTTPFVPIFEETVFLDSPGVQPSLPSVSTSSPISGDSWMNYSSNSSDDYTSLSTAVRNSISLGGADGNAHQELHSDDDDDDHSNHSSSSAAEPMTPQKIKRNFEHLIIDHENNSDANGSSGMAGRSKAMAALSLCADDAETEVISKRHRGGKDTTSSKMLSSAAAASPSVPIVGKRRPTLKSDAKTSTNSSRRNSSAAHSATGVDIRMIDFAHTAFMRQSGDVSGNGGLFTQDASMVHHQGPDNGFLRGLDSLKRLLTEICDEGH